MFNGDRSLPAEKDEGGDDPVEDEAGRRVPEDEFGLNGARMMGEVPEAVQEETEAEEADVEVERGNGKKHEEQQDEGLDEYFAEAAVHESEAEIDAGGYAEQYCEEADGEVVRKPHAQGVWSGAKSPCRGANRGGRAS